MSKGFDNLNIKSAVKSHSKINLDSQHLTTLQFGQIIPSFTTSTIPGDKFTIDQSAFARMAPLVVPSYGKAYLKNAAFYVPFHQVMEEADAYFAGKVKWQGQNTVLRTFTMDDLFNLFNNSLCSAVVPVSIPDPGRQGQTMPNPNYDVYDFKYNNGSAEIRKKFIPFGKYVYKVMRSLGYQIPENVNWSSGSEWMTTRKNTKVNALPFLCFCKAYNDYMSQSQRFNTSALSSALLLIRQGKDATYSWSGVTAKYTASTGNINGALLGYMLSQIHLCYESDMFTSAWESPNAPLSGLENVGSISFPYVGTSTEDGTVTSTTGNVMTAVYSSGISQRALNFLRAFDNFVRRNNYAGSRDVQQIYARFGIKSDEYRTHYAEGLGTSYIPLQIGDVTATAQTGDPSTDESAVAVGDYAGKGIISGDGHWSVEANDFGQVVVLSWISVKPVYADGFDYEVLKKDVYDFYNPEFDGVGPRVISNQEVYTNAHDGTTTTIDGVYGFTERYNEYRYGKDRITGDFKLFPDLAAWHFGRDLQNVRESNSMKAQTTAMVTMSRDASEYNRIFNVNDDQEDKFFVDFRFGVNAMRPIKNLSGVTDLGEGGLTVQRNGNELN